MKLRFGNQVVETIETTPSYDYQNLVGEVGGTLGLFLGFGGMSIYEIFLAHAVSKSQSLRVKKLLSFGMWLILWLCFVFFSSQAVAMFLEEPLSMTKLVSNEEANFPMLTFCSRKTYYSDLFIDSGDVSFYSMLEATLENSSNPDILIQEIVDASWDIDDIINEVYIKTDNDQITAKGNIWTPVYHNDYGICYTLDIRKADNFSDTNKASITVSLEFTGYNPFGSSGKADILMHTNEDLPSATDYSSILNYYPSIDWPSEYNIKQTKVLRQPSNSRPCADSHEKVCKDIHLYNLIKETYSCEIPISFTGNHLPMNETLQSCHSKIILKALKMRSQTHPDCPSIVPCQFTKFEFVTECNNWFLDSPRVPNLAIKMNNHVEVYQFSLQYTIGKVI